MTARARLAGAATTSAADLAGAYERTLTRADIERTDDLRDESAPGQGKPEPGPLELALEDGTLTMTDVGAGVTIRQDFSATSDGAFRIGAYQAPDQGSSAGRTSADRRLHVEAVRGRAQTRRRPGQMRGSRLEPDRRVAAPLNLPSSGDLDYMPFSHRVR